MAQTITGRSKSYCRDIKILANVCSAVQNRYQTNFSVCVDFSVVL